MACNPTNSCLQRRWATTLNDIPKGHGSTEKVPFPYPLFPTPTPHQIFHLHRGATQDEIKSRYYELVRCYHPDSHHCRLLSPNEAHSRFQSITAAYDYLRGRASSHTPGAKTWGPNSQANSNFDPYLYELARRRRAYHASQEGRSAKSDGFGAPRGSRTDNFQEDGKKERIILAFGIFTLIIGLYPSFIVFPFQLEKNHKAAVMNLTQARNDAKKMGDERRMEIRKRVQDIHTQSSVHYRGESSSISKDLAGKVE